MCRDRELEFIAERYSRRHPDLTQLIVAMALKAILKLFPMLFEIIRQSKPFNRQQKHPIHRALQFFMAFWCLVNLSHALFAMTQMKCLFLINLHQSPFPGTKGRTLINVSKQRIASAIIKCIGNDQFYPAIERYI